MEERIRKVSGFFFFFSRPFLPFTQYIHLSSSFFSHNFFFFFSPVVEERKAADLVGQPVGLRGRKKREERKKKKNGRLRGWVGEKKKKMGDKRGPKDEKNFFLKLLFKF